jgi:hypothetical protein
MCRSTFAAIFATFLGKAPDLRVHIRYQRTFQGWVRRSPSHSLVLFEIHLNVKTSLQPKADPVSGAGPGPVQVRHLGRPGPWYHTGGWKHYQPPGDPVWLVPPIPPSRSDHSRRYDLKRSVDFDSSGEGSISTIRHSWRNVCVKAFTYRHRQVGCC